MPGLPFCAITARVGSNARQTHFDALSDIPAAGSHSVRSCAMRYYFSMPAREYDGRIDARAERAELIPAKILLDAAGITFR